MTQQSAAAPPVFPAAPSPEADNDWPLRPWLLAGLLGLAALLIHFVTQGHEQSPGWMALAAFLFFGSIFAAFAVKRHRWLTPALAALAAGLVMAGLAWRAVDPGDYLADEIFAFAAGIVATTLALPLFQAGFHRTRFDTPYRETHSHIWNDLVSGVGALAFVALSWALLAVLSELFQLLKIDVIKNLMNQEWFGWTYSGVTFGAALGTLRNQQKILGTLQSVVLVVLALLAVPLAAALVMFLLAMILSGPAVLWEATRSATPVLLACALGAFVLTNAIIRDDDSAMTGSRIMRLAAFVLAIGIFPLTVFAAISMGTRVAQHGLSPERLWGLVAIAFACAYGLAYIVALVRGGRAGWHDRLRRANLHLAVGGCGLALLLALPIFDFGAISARNQIARLDAGKTDLSTFDFAALRWDFGEAGRAALRELVKTSDGPLMAKAQEALAQKQRPYRMTVEDDRVDERLANLRVDAEDPAVRQQVRDYVASQMWLCNRPCIIVDLGTGAGSTRKMARLEDRRSMPFDLDMNATYSPQTTVQIVEAAPVESVQEVDIGAKSEVEIRPYTGRQIYVDGKPLGVPFE